MGNFKSCFAFPAKKAVVINADGTHHVVELPMTVGEAAFRFAGGVSICDMENILQDGSPSPIKTRQKLQAGRFYIFLPPTHVGKEISDEQKEIVIANINRWRETHKKRNRVADADADSMPNLSVLWSS